MKDYATEFWDAMIERENKMCEIIRLRGELKDMADKKNRGDKMDNDKNEVKAIERELLKHFKKLQGIFPGLTRIEFGVQHLSSFADPQIYGSYHVLGSEEVQGETYDELMRPLFLYKKF